MDKDKLFERRLEEEEHEIPDIGTIRYRALARDEQMHLSKIDDILKRERQMLAMAMVDPTMTFDEVKRWQAASPGGELEAVTVRIAQMSGMLEDEDTEKEVVTRFPDESDV